MNNNSGVLRKRNLVSAIFLIAGTCIGGGMLALPVATGVTGFIPSLALMFLCWLMMTATALLLIEVSLWLEEGAHIITMTSRILGFAGKAVSWCLYLFICYASLVAYTAGGGVQIATAFREHFALIISKELGAVLFVLIFGSVVYLGSRIIGRVNAVLFTGMIAAYFCLIGIGIGEVKPQLLGNIWWPGSLLTIPLLLTAFSCQTMIPSLTPYLKRDVKALRLVVIAGTTLAFIIYAIWQCLILGIVPVEGPTGLAEALVRGEPPTQFLREHVQSEWIYGVAEYFSFFAIVTSFLGIALGLMDFLADGLKIHKKGFGKVWLGLLIVLPTILFATQFERIFLVALETSGGFGDAILNGIIPVLMVWRGRYYLNLNKDAKFTLFGGKPLLLFIFAFFLFALIIEIILQTGPMSAVYEPFEVPAHHI